MKTKLFTKNSYVAILMALVLAFSVQGNPANALTFGTSRSGDLQTVDTGDEFTMRFSVNLRPPQAVEPNTRRGSTTDIEYASGDRSRPATPGTLTGNYTETTDSGYAEGDTHYYTVTTTSENHGGTAFTLTTNTRNWVTESEAYYYNDESVSITSNPTVTLQKGRTDVASLTETASESDQRLTSSVTLKGEHDTAGVVNITITDTTPTADFPSDAQPPGTRASAVFTIYVVGDAATTTATAVELVGTSGGTDALEYQVRGNQDSRIFINVEGGANLPVTITVNGGGRVYVKAASDRRTSAMTNLSTSSAAPVFLNMNSRTNKVTVNIQSVGSHTATYIYGNPSLEKIRGTDQSGLAGGRLNTALGVRLTDFGGRAISGIPVTFAETNGVFIPVPDQTLYKAANTDDILTATSTSPGDANDSIIVYTDSKGEAYVYYQFASADTGTIPVTASIATTRATTTFRPRVEDTSRRPTLEIVSGNNQRTNENGELENPLVVVVRRNRNRLPGHNVTFVARKGILTGNSTSGKRVTVTSDNQGEAEVQYDQDPGSGSDTVTVSITSDGITPTPPISYEREVVFGINGGQGTRAPTPAPATNTITISLSSSTGAPGDEIDVEVDSSPQGVLVNIDSGDLSDADFSRLSGGTPFTSTLTLPAAEDTYRFSAERSGFTSDSATVRVVAETAATGARLSIDVAGSGTTRTVTVTALNAQGGEVPGLDVTLSGSALIGGARTVRVDTPTPITVRTGTLQAAATGFTSATESITVTAGGTGTTPPATSTGGTLTLTAVSAVVNGSQTVEVTARTTAGTAVGGLTVSLSGAGFTTRTVTTLSTGSVRAIVALPDTTGSHLLYATATGYTAGSVILTATGQTATTPTTATPTTAGDPSRISISGLSTHTGTVNEALDTSLSVRVVDANGIGVEDARVIFRVRTGQGRLSDRGNGRAIAVATDSNGSARASYTPLSASSTVSASVTGVSTGVTFTITADGVPATTTPTTGTPATSTPTVSPVVNTGVAASSRPPMLWISGGKIYGLVGTDVQEFISGVENAISLAVGGGKLYWTEQTSETRGTLNSANLDGTGATELKDLWGVPRGIAVDTAGSHLYWVDADNRLQRSNLDGSGIQNVLRNLSDPIDIALANGNAYWTQDNGSVRFVNLTGTKNLRNISTGMDAAGSIAIAGGKVYWTEQIDGTYGTLNSANLDGTDAKELRDDALWGAPVGIAVDTARSKLYWTDAAGRLQRSNLDGSGIHNVAKGLGSPGDLVLSNSITAPTGTPSTTTTTTSTTASKYDVNGDGTVDSKDVDAILVALAAGSTDTKYDVDGDGTVNIFDLIDLRGQIQGAAAAPTLLGMKFSSVQIERLQGLIDELIASGDRSPAALKTLIYLQQLIVMARPEKTQLLANYPNPFNPETWIPYELATHTDVCITIYNAQGVVIRTLQLGQQSAGYYTDRERAAYWDGKNALGEQVASGIYFYQLETDDMSSLRKMVILK